MGVLAGAGRRVVNLIYRPIDNLTLVARAVWHAVALVVAAGWWAFAALAVVAVVAVVRAVQR